MARVVWSLREDGIIVPLTSDETSDAKLWLFSLSNTLKADQFVEVLVTLWALWWARRKAIHESEFQSPLSTHLFIQRYLDEIRGCDFMQKKARAASSFPSQRPAPIQRWVPPPDDASKLNVDGAVAKTANKGAVGVICRDAQGNYMGASAMVLDGVLDLEILEAHACREALALSEDLMLRNIQIASDCLRVVKEINSGQAFGDYCMIVKEFNSRKLSFQACEICHERREQNVEAHNLARMATTLEVGRYIWLTAPPPNLCIPVSLAT